MDDYIERNINRSWNFEERKKFLEKMIEECPLKTAHFCRELSTDEYTFKVKYKNVERVRKAYLEVTELSTH